MYRRTDMKKKILLVIMDGIGMGSKKASDIFYRAETPTLDQLLVECPWTTLKAHGTAVGLPTDDDMGNSEVGHNALGCGQIYAQGAKRVGEALESRELYEGIVWQEMTSNCISHGSTLHFIGLLSDGNVHSNIEHLLDMIEEAKEAGVYKLRIHVLLDGRDVGATSALNYIDQLEQTLAKLRDDRFDGRIASGGGRMCMTMDRYGADWDMVKRGWDTHVKGIGRQFVSANEAVKAYRAEIPELSDQYIPSFVIAEQGEPIGKIVDRDSVILFNFRGDRAIELSRAFDEETFEYFDRGHMPQVKFAGMIQYDGDAQIPKRFLVEPPHITETLSEVLIANNLRQYAVSETQKYGHVTYFWNGNKSEKFNQNLETFVEIASDRTPFEQRPWMKSAEITDNVIQAIQSDQYEFIRCNFPNGDMVGHTGNIEATIIAIEAVDLAIARLVAACQKHDVTLIITADHGNVDEMYEKDDRQVKTAHSLNKVPFIIYDTKTHYRFKEGNYGLANVAPTIGAMLALDIPGCWEESMIE